MIVPGRRWNSSYETVDGGALVNGVFETGDIIGALETGDIICGCGTGGIIVVGSEPGTDGGSVGVGTAGVGPLGV